MEKPLRRPRPVKRPRATRPAGAPPRAQEDAIRGLGGALSSALSRRLSDLSARVERQVSAHARTLASEVTADVVGLVTTGEQLGYVRARAELGEWLSDRAAQLAQAGYTAEGEALREAGVTWLTRAVLTPTDLAPGGTPGEELASEMARRAARLR